MNVFDVLAVGMALCAIPIYRQLTYVTRPRINKRFRAVRREESDAVFSAVMWFALAMILDFVDSLPGTGIGTKTALGQNILEPASHLAIVTALVWGLWKAREIRTHAVVVLAGLGLFGFVCSTFTGEDTTIRHVANGLMPAYSWLVTAICVVSMVRIAWPLGRDQFEVLLVLGVLALAVAVAQNELIIQWAGGQAHYPELK